jgi:hypothetical protein
VPHFIVASEQPQRPGRWLMSAVRMITSGRQGPSTAEPPDGPTLSSHSIHWPCNIDTHGSVCARHLGMRRES